MNTPIDLDARRGFLRELVGAGLLLPLGAPGVYGRSGTFERVLAQFERLMTEAHQADEPEVLRFPPIFSRSDYGCLGHIHSFPDQLGSVHSFAGADREHREMIRKLQAGEEWTEELDPSEVMLLPSACYPLYPTASGRLPPGGRLVDIQAYVFRHEPSDDPARMLAFRQREFVRLGTPEQALAHRDDLLRRFADLLEFVGLAAEAVVANDPFFGRGGCLAKATQREQALKYELIVPIGSSGGPMAVASANYHRDYFGQAFGITTSDGAIAHTACAGFGLERVVLALFTNHGFELRSWPAPVRRRLDLG